MELGNDKYNNMNSPLISVQNLTLNALNKYMNKVNLTAIQITSPFSMANVVPNWTKIGNVWTVTSTSITGVGKIDGEGHLHMTIQDRGKTEPTP